MKPNYYLAISLIISLMLSNYSMAQHNHNHNSETEEHVDHPPHGGVLKDIGKYKIEMVVNIFLKKDQLVFYIYKNNLKPLSNIDITGEITFKNNNLESNSDKLEPKGTNAYVAQMDDSGSNECTVEFLIKNKKVKVDFVISSVTTKMANYSCPMHRNVEESKPGICPLCGMQLEKINN